MSKVINMNDIRKNAAANKCPEKQAKNYYEQKLDLIQLNGRFEIGRYESIVNDFIEKVKGLAIMETPMNMFVEQWINDALLNNVMYGFVQPIFEGNQPACMSDEEYSMIREKMYADLLRKYDVEGEPPF